MSRIITLTTDFGESDAYVASMKGVVLGINPNVKLVDVSHTVEPQNIRQASFIINSFYPYFPKNTIHLVIVDPGVGTKRRGVLLRTPDADFIAPDNGVLSGVLSRFTAGIDVEKTENGIMRVKLPSVLEAVSLTNPRFWRDRVSPTFHGRDIFAPVAAAISMGFKPVEFGEPLKSMEFLPQPKPEHLENGALTGNVIYIDRFGNLITNITREDITALGTVRVKIGGREIIRISKNYAETGGLLALFNSTGNLEIAAGNASAKDTLGARIGDEVIIEAVPNS